jgi:hypothetical protein
MKRIIYRFFLSAILITCLADSSGAQESTATKSHDFWHRVVVGGNIGLQIGDVTGIIISPEVAVRLVDQLYGGLGFTYQYSSFKNYYYDTKTNQYLNFKQNTYGGKIFFRYYLSSLFDNFLGNFFAHVEYEYLTYTRPYTFNPNGPILDPYANAYSYGNEHVEINSLFVGGGYHQPVGGRVFLDFLILYNLNDSYNSPYSNPLFRVGFGVGL